jgi:hypothetical protein
MEALPLLLLVEDHLVQYLVYRYNLSFAVSLDRLCYLAKDLATRLASAPRY